MIEVAVVNRGAMTIAGRIRVCACAVMAGLMMALSLSDVRAFAGDAPQGAPAETRFPAGGSFDRIEMTPREFLSVVRKIRAVGDFRQYEKVVPLLPFPVGEIQSTDGATYLDEGQGPPWLGSIIYAIRAPYQGRWFVRFKLVRDVLCVTRKDILKSFGRDDPELHVGYPDNLSEAAFARELDVNQSLRRPPYWMRYTRDGAAALEFEFENNRCLYGVTIGDPGVTHVTISLQVQY